MPDKVFCRGEIQNQIMALTVTADFHADYLAMDFYAAVACATPSRKLEISKRHFSYWRITQYYIEWQVVIVSKNSIV